MVNAGGHVVSQNSLHMQLIVLLDDTQQSQPITMLQLVKLKIMRMMRQDYDLILISVKKRFVLLFTVSHNGTNR